MDAVDLGRSLFAGVLARKISDTRRPLVLAGAAVSAVALACAVVVGGGWRWLAVVVLVVAVATTIGIWLFGTLALLLVRRIISADRRDLGDAGDAVDQAVEDLDLPTGPVAVIRLAWRLRSGVGHEVERVREIGEELIARLD